MSDSAEARIRRMMASFPAMDTSQIGARLGLPEPVVYGVWVRVRDRRRAIRQMVEANLPKESAHG